MFNSDPQIKSFRLYQGKTSLKQIGLIVLVALFFIGLVWLGGWGVDREIEKTGNVKVEQKELAETEKEIKFQEESNQIVNIPKIIEIKEEDFKAVFQAVPYYEEKQKIESYVLQYPNSGKKQYVYRFYSSKSLDEILKFYRDWAKKNNWHEANLVKENNFYSLYLTQSNDMLVAKIFKDNDKVIVNLDLVREK